MEFGNTYRSAASGSPGCAAVEDDLLDETGAGLGVLTRANQIHGSVPGQREIELRCFGKSLISRDSSRPRDGIPPAESPGTATSPRDQAAWRDLGCSSLALSIEID